jgi:hypothetical protein
MKRIILCLSLLLSVCCSYAHVGSPGVTFEGNAGPYKLIASIMPPDVIPGTALVSVYLENAPKGIHITAKPIYWFAGADGTPRADTAEPSATEPGRFDVKIWLMSMGTSSVEIMVDGPQGKGKVVVPVMAVSTAKRAMPAGLGWGLLAMAVFLVILMVTIISASVSDSLLSPAEQLSGKLRRKRITGGVVGLVVLGLILWGGKSWWNAAANNYTRFMYQPLQATTKVNTQSGLLTFQIDTADLNAMNRSRRMNVTRKINYLVPDHGKLMHMFLVRAGELDAFAHLHPRRVDSVTFVAAMPNLPAGKYWVYADITRLSGFAETIVDTLDIKDQTFRMASNRPQIKLPVDRDDTYFTTTPVNGRNIPASLKPSIMCGSPGVEVKQQDGSTAVWVQDAGKPIRSGELTNLNFEVLDPDRKPAQLEPYLGMAAHAVILKDDGSVYIHLHPSGSYSMGSQKAILDRIAFHQPLDKYLPEPRVFADSINHLVARLDALPDAERDKLLTVGMNHATTGVNAHQGMNHISFPYTFPQPGKYRIWIQTKRNGQILNSAFDAEVK